MIDPPETRWRPVASSRKITAWTAKLLASRKERLLISGYGLDLLAALLDDEAIRG